MTETINKFFSQLLNENFDKDTLSIASILNESFITGKAISLSEEDYMNFSSNIDILRNKLDFVQNQILLSEDGEIADLISIIEKSDEYVVKKKKLLTGEFKIEDVKSFYRTMIETLNVLATQVNKLEEKDIKDLVKKDTFKNNFNLFFLPFLNSEMKSIIDEVIANPNSHSHLGAVGKYMEEHKEDLRTQNKKFIEDIKKTNDFIVILKKIKTEYEDIYKKVKEGDKEHLNKIYKFIAEFYYACLMKIVIVTKFLIRAHLTKKVTDEVKDKVDNVKDKVDDVKEKTKETLTGQSKKSDMEADAELEVNSKEVDKETNKKIK